MANSAKSEKEEDPSKFAFPQQTSPKAPPNGTTALQLSKGQAKTQPVT
jgi:hypothetical protein